MESVVINVKYISILDMRRFYLQNVLLNGNKNKPFFIKTTQF